MSGRHNTNPTYDGHVLSYWPEASPRGLAKKFYYVNGINTDPKTHRIVAEIIANITQSRVTGIYNATGGTMVDLTQCVGDWINIFRSQVGEQGFFQDRLSQSAIDRLSSISTTIANLSPFAHAMREAHIAPDEIARTRSLKSMRKALKRNLASLSLFDQITRNLDARQIIVAHSQGNLITSFALWGVQAVYGSRALSKLQIRSISSPSPAWPRGINHRIKVYGQRDDPVTWFDPKNWTGNRSAGFWANFFGKDPVGYVKSGGIAAHSAEYNIIKTSLYRRLRADAGIASF